MALSKPVAYRRLCFLQNASSLFGAPWKLNEIAELFSLGQEFICRLLYKLSMNHLFRIFVHSSTDFHSRKIQQSIDDLIINKESFI